MSLPRLRQVAGRGAPGGARQSHNRQDDEPMHVLKNIVYSRWLGFTLTAALVLTAYSFMLQAPFRGMDDSVSIVQNSDIRSFHNIPKIFSSSFFGDRSYYRPLVSLSYAVEYHLFGLDAFFYNLDNVILHILNTFAVFALINRLLKDRAVAFWVSLLFAVHPVQWEAVANVSGRAILLNAFFVLIAFRLFIDFCDRGKILLLAGSLLSFTLAFFCKESAAILPIVLALYLAFFHREKIKLWYSLAPFFLIVLGFILLRRQLGITELFGWGAWNALFFGFMTFAQGVITYLRLFIFPVDLYFDRSRMVFQNIYDPQLLATAVFWLAAVIALWRWRAKAGFKIIFFIFWFSVELAPVSQIVTSLGVQPGFISLAEHFLYVPSVAMFVLLVLAVEHLIHLNGTKKWCSPLIAKTALTGFFVFLFLTTIQQNIYASSELAMLRRSIEKQPFNSRVQYSLGMYYVNHGMFEVAERYFRQAIAMDPWNVRAQIAFGKALCDQGKYGEGIAVYESIQHPGSQEALLKENLRLSREIFRRAIASSPPVNAGSSQ